MIMFQFQLEGEQLNNKRWAFENGYIKGDFQIYVDGQVYFEEKHINIVELAIQLGKWFDLVRHGVMRDFQYDPLASDEYVLEFFIQQESVKLYSPIQKMELSQLRIETVKNAVLRFLVALNEKLHEIDYVIRLDQFIHKNGSENTKAIMLFEQNEYTEAFALFNKLAKERPTVQSLNNLAWMYLREEEDMDQAQRLLNQVLMLQPQSPFPYMMLGEIALHKKQFQQAKGYLQTALSQGVTEEASYNLAIAHFKLAEYEEAGQKFSSCAGDSGMTQLHEVVAWMFAGKKEKTKALLDNWNEEAYDYIGAIEIADVYVELGCYKEARKQFEKEWQSDISATYIVSRYAYTLFQLGEVTACQTIVRQAVQQTVEEMFDVQQEEVDEHWTVEDKAEHIEELTAQKQVLETLVESLQNGEVPPFGYDMYPMGGCQLFGCSQHGNPEYKGA